MERNRSIRTAVAACVLSLTLSAASPARTIYVDDDAPADFRTIQAAIDDANDGDTVLVAPGTYTGPGNRDIDFRGKAITVRGTDPNDRDMVRRTVVDCGGTAKEAHRGFLFASGEGADSVLSGVTITGGYAPSISLSTYKTLVGGGICCNKSGPTVTHCVVWGNLAEQGGGGLFTCEGSPVIRYCEFRSNVSSSTGAGGIEVSGGQPVVSSCLITDNYGDLCGGISWGSAFPLLLENCLIGYNKGRYGSAGVRIGGSADAEILHCTIIENHSEGGNWGAGLYLNSARTLRLTNCIVWGNACAGTRNQDTQVGWYGIKRIDYSCVEGWNGKLAGAGSFGRDPLLTRDAHLQSRSPCRDAGDPNSSDARTSFDVDGEVRLQGPRVDIGCDEFADADGDQLPDAWERRCFGDLTRADAAGNPDGDPWQNGAEYVRGSNPLRPPTTYYVDPVVGQDSGDGLTALPGDGHGPKATIRAALAAAQARDQDQIVLMPGLYTGEGNRNNDFGGKEVTVRSVDPNDPDVVAATVIDCSGTRSLQAMTPWLVTTSVFVLERLAGTESRRAFMLWSREGGDARIQGLTLVNGVAGAGGGAVVCEWSSPRIVNCTFRDNESAQQGGAICCGNGNAVIERCTLEQNRAAYGGAIACSSLDGRPRIARCVIRDNEAEFSGGGLDCGRGAIVSGCLIVRNRAQGGPGTPQDFRYPQGGGGIFLRSGGAALVNCTVAGNSAAHGSGLLSGCIRAGPGWATLERCIIWGNTGGETGDVAFRYCCQGCVVGEAPVGLWVRQSCLPGLVSTGYGGFSYVEDANCTHADPRFVSLENDDYHLQGDSPCIDVGTAFLPGQPAATDLDEAGRLVDFDDDGIAQIDMGVYEARPPGGTFLVAGPQSVQFHGYDSASPPEPQKLTVRSRGMSGLPWTIECDCPWLAVSPLSGAGGMDVVLRVKAMALPAGTYRSEFLIHAPLAVNSPICIPVELQIGRTRRVPESYATIQAAVDAADSGDVIVLADGLYTGAGNRDIALPAKRLHIRSVGGPQGCIIDCESSETGAHLGFTMHSGGADITCEGLTLRRARRGIMVDSIRLRLVNCHIVACDYGCDVEDSRLLVEACQFRDGGAPLEAYGCDVKVLNTTVTHNATGMSFGSSLVDIRNTQIRQSGGSGLSVNYCLAVTLDHCLIVENGGDGSASRAIALAGSPTTIRNCTIVGNTSWRGKGETGPLSADDAKQVQVVNSILWDNQHIAEDLLSQCVVRFSDIQGGWPGEGNIDADPQFVSPGRWNLGTTRGASAWTEGDYHLQSQAGRWEASNGSWMSDEVTSPCIDAGDPNSPAGDEPEPNGGRINMGAYGGTAEASKSHSMP